MAGDVHIFGIRHHGPGCARSLRAALEALEPDCVLVEGPPDAEGVLSLAGDEAMKPPVALLIYPDGAPERAAYYPFAVFSPEWQAIRYSLARGIPLHFMDLPLAHRFAAQAPPEAPAESTTPEAGAEGAEDHDDSDASMPARDPDEAVPASDRGDLRIDPLGVLAEAAGYNDRELWWEHQVEQRQDPTGLFQGILEAMTALRAEHPPPVGHEAQREASMRKIIRAARRKHARVAVVCGAWHGPALVDLRGSKADNALLKGMAKKKVVATWIPWTYDRMTYRSGYGAGVRSPGWYQHLWEAPDRAAIRWATRAARLLRQQDLDASSAGVIEVVRLAETLAALRDLPLPGLAELRQALGSALCHGETAPLRLIAHELEVGHALGEVPEGAPMVPLHQDLQRWQKKLRLRPSAEIRDLKLDLRKETDLLRSTLLHRLVLLGVDWGGRTEASGERGDGSFREQWRLQWRPELAVLVIEANLYGNTVEEATIEQVRQASTVAGLGELTILLERILPADIGAAIPPLLARLQAVAAVTADVRELMRALPPLARVSRYGSVRGSREADLAPLLDGFLGRILVGLAPACASLDDDAAAEMIEGLGEVHEAIRLVDRADLRDPWTLALRALMERESCHPRVRGRAARLRLELGDLDERGLGEAASLALSRAHEPSRAAAWAEGLLRGSGLVLVHQEAIWRVLDGWLCALSEEAFAAIAPMLRRAFSEFTDPERRTMAAKVRTLGGPRRDPANAPDTGTPLDPERAARVLPVLAAILGVAAPTATLPAPSTAAEELP